MHYYCTFDINQTHCLGLMAINNLLSNREKFLVLFLYRTQRNFRKHENIIYYFFVYRLCLLGLGDGVTSRLRLDAGHCRGTEWHGPESIKKSDYCQISEAVNFGLSPHERSSKE